MAEKSDKLLIGRIFGILSVVFALISAMGLGGIILGIIGLVQLKDQNKSVAKKSRMLNIIGIVLGAIILIINIVYMFITIPLGDFGLGY